MYAMKSLNSVAKIRSRRKKWKHLLLLCQLHSVELLLYAYSLLQYFQSRESFSTKLLLHSNLETCLCSRNVMKPSFPKYPNTDQPWPRTVSKNQSRISTTSLKWRYFLERRNTSKQNSLARSSTLSTWMKSCDRRQPSIRDNYQFREHFRTLRYRECGKKVGSWMKKHGVMDKASPNRKIVDSSPISVCVPFHRKKYVCNVTTTMVLRVSFILAYTVILFWYISIFQTFQFVHTLGLERNPVLEWSLGRAEINTHSMRWWIGHWCSTLPEVFPHLWKLTCFT